jgi:hypothetical protein
MDKGAYSTLSDETGSTRYEVSADEKTMTMD